LQIFIGLSLKQRQAFFMILARFKMQLILKSKNLINDRLFLASVAVSAFLFMAIWSLNLEHIKNENYLGKKIFNRTDRYLFFAPPAEVIHFTLGYQDVLADSFWLRFLQDSDTCEQSLAPVGASRVGFGHVANCNQGWGYHILDVIFEAAPRWRHPAVVGPMLLSVVIDDIDGASLSFKKAVRNFPNDWTILFRAGYHFLNETNEHELAAKYFNESGKYGAPAWVHSLAAKIYSENGRLTIARVVLVDALKRVPEGINRNKILERLKEIEEKISKLKK
jgi:hypothetical protein